MKKKKLPTIEWKEIKLSKKQRLEIQDTFDCIKGHLEYTPDMHPAILIDAITSMKYDLDLLTRSLEKEITTYYNNIQSVVDED